MISRTSKLLIAALLALPAPAFGLSCAPPDPVRQLGYAKTSGIDMVVLQGAVRRAGADRSLGPVNPDEPAGLNNGVESEAPYKFAGSILSADQPPVAVSADMTVTLRCVLGWCGRMDDTAIGLFLARGSATVGYMVETGPCGGSYYPAPLKPETIRALRECLADGNCPD